MLRIQVQLIPDGDETATRLLGEVEIVNDGTGTELTGNYLIVMNEYDEHIPGRRSIFRTTAMIEDMERDIARPMQVAGIAMNLLAPVKKTLSNNLEPWGKILSKEEV
ncbi:hypothetical protein [Cupriavidus sp. TMH.W2]|uniref:hypothetical protein n=1 Tax=Cupriavidus sp. TMH.W2 TaxID=3434465 RepID=UPI003D78618E